MKPQHNQPPSGLALSLCITSNCNRRCPECCIGVGIDVDGSPFKGCDMSWEEIERVGRTIGKLHEITVTGGEPSFHKDWDNIAPKFRSVLQCDNLVCFCNGWGFRRNPGSFLHFDKVIVTIYNETVFPGCPSNAEDIEFMRNFMAKAGQAHKFVAGNVVHQPRRKGDGTGAGCPRASNTCISYWQGKLYGCCVAPGIDGRIGVDLTPNWYEDVMATELPCAHCMFG